MKPGTVLLLALVVAALGAFVWFVERDLPSSEERAGEAKRLLRVEVDEVDAVTVAWGETTVRAERTAEPVRDEAAEEPARPAGWRLVEPVAGPAERWEVEGLLRALARLESARTMPLGGEVEASAVGLDSPRGRVTLELRGGGRRTLLVGAAVPASNDVMVGLPEPRSERSPEAAEVVDGGFVDRLERLAEDPESWREPEPEPEPEPAGPASPP